MKCADPPEAAGQDAGVPLDWKAMYTLGLGPCSSADVITFFPTTGANPNYDADTLGHAQWGSENVGV